MEKYVNVSKLTVGMISLLNAKNTLRAVVCYFWDASVTSNSLSLGSSFLKLIACNNVGLQSTCDRKLMTLNVSQEICLQSSKAMFGIIPEQSFKQWGDDKIDGGERGTVFN